MTLFRDIKMFRPHQGVTVTTGFYKGAAGSVMEVNTEYLRVQVHISGFFQGEKIDVRAWFDTSEIEPMT